MPLMNKERRALLILEDGSAYPGFAFAGQGEALGEVVFNTGMTGYQEIITDPSYKGQIVTMTYPLIGNYGCNPEDMESAGIHLEGFICREYQEWPSNWRSRQTLKAFLEGHGKLGIEGIDTRALTRRIRLAGAMRGILTTESQDIQALLERVRTYPGLVGRDLVKEVACKEPYQWKDNACQSLSHPITHATPSVIPAKAGIQTVETLENTNLDDGCPIGDLRVCVLDCGVKFNILRHLESRGCEVIVLPAATTAKDILSYQPDGVLLSNGPGDPAALPYIVETVRGLLGKVPVFGICLGHQILGQAVGGRTAKLKFGHHGINQPVKNQLTGRIEITSQNHGFVVLPESVPKTLSKTHNNLNDQTSEGFLDESLPAFSVQYHPEAAPGPNDAVYLFDRFVQMMKTQKAKNA
jgi:carbamoyl-phosphate synthase small subunit